MTEFAIDSFNKETKAFIADSLINGISQRKTAEKLSAKGIIISDVSIGRWWKENRLNYIADEEENAATINVDKAIDNLIAKLDKTEIKYKYNDQRLVIQELLLELMLRYLVDINHQTKLKQENLINHYPTDLMSSLKIISDLYLKVKDDNKYLRDENDETLF
jgi:hypothetical protein